MADMIATIVMGGALLFFYFMPTYFAVTGDRQPGNVFIVNLLFGWTVVGWLIAFAMAAAGPRQAG